VALAPTLSPLLRPFPSMLLYAPAGRGRVNVQLIEVFYPLPLSSGDSKVAPLSNIKRAPP
jgi:hypothetical protein